MTVPSPQTHPAERETLAGEAMREAVAREIAPRAWQAADELREWPDSEYRRAHMMQCGPSLEAADRILAGPIASELARLTAERDEARDLSGLTWTAPDIDAVGQWAEEKGAAGIRERMNRLFRRAVAAEQIRALAATPPEARQTETGWKQISVAPKGRDANGKMPIILLIAQYPSGTGHWTDVRQGWWDELQERWERWTHVFQPTHFRIVTPPAIGNLEGEGRS